MAGGTLRISRVLGSRDLEKLLAPMVVWLIVRFALAVYYPVEARCSERGYDVI